MTTIKRAGKGGRVLSYGSSLPTTPTQTVGQLNIEGGEIEDSFFQPESSSLLQILPNSNRPSPLLVNAALVLGQIFFGTGSIIAALGLPSCNPFAFALYREICAGFILLSASIWWTTRTHTETLRQQQQEEDIMKAGDSTINNSDDDIDKIRPKPKSLLNMTLEPLYQNPIRFLWLGLAIFANQAGVIVGIKLAGPVTAAVWQPSQPIMTAAISMALRWEPINIWRVIGAGIAFGGCALMVMLAPGSASSMEEQTREMEVTSDGNTILLKDGKHQEQSSSSFTFFIGNLLFFVNCLGTSLYVILSKKVLKLYTPLSVTAWTYNIAAIFMALTAVITSKLDFVMDLLCPDCSKNGTIWTIPSGAYFALFYFIVLNSVTAYAILTWANQYATGTLVMGFTVLQPVTVAILTLLLLGMGAYPRCSSIAGSDPDKACLDPPGIGSLCGMASVIVGLYLVIMTEPESSEKTMTDTITSSLTETAYQELPRNKSTEDD